MLFLRNNAAGQKSLARLEKQHDQGQAVTIFAHKLARAVYDMLKHVGWHLCTEIQSEHETA